MRIVRCIAYERGDEPREEAWCELKLDHMQRECASEPRQQEHSHQQWERATREQVLETKPRLD